jgi:hypothetical protein
MQGRQKRNAGALALWSCLFACGPDLVASDGGTSDDGTSDEGTSDDGGEPVVFPNMPLPPVDVDAWCDDPGLLPPFAEQLSVPVTRLERQGLCGHLMTWYSEGESSYSTLWYPDGSIEDLGTAPRVGSDVFSPTGRLLAWAEGEDGAPQRVTIRDLQTGVSRTIETQENATYGFVRLPDNDHGAAPWVCHGGVLELVGVEPEDSRVLANDVSCETVSGAELSTRLVYADLDEVLSVVEAKDGTRWSTGVGDVRNTRLSPEGRLAVGYGDELSDRVVDLDRSEVLASCDHPQFDQALASAAPLFVLCDRALSVWRDEVLEPIHDEVPQSSVSPTPDGSATFSRVFAHQRENWFVPAGDASDAQLVISVQDEDLQYIRRSRGGQYGWFPVETSACADVACTQTITEIWMWSTAGLGGSMLVAADWTRLHVFDDGQALGYGSPIEGPLPEGVPIPPPQLILVGVDGVPAATWSIDRPWSASPLDDGRVLLRLHYDLHDYWIIFDRDSPVIETLLGPVTLDRGAPRIDSRLGLLAILVDSEPAGVGPYLLYWGGVPD